MQTIAVMIIITMAVGFASWRVYQTFQRREGPAEAVR